MYHEYNYVYNAAVFSLPTCLPPFISLPSCLPPFILTANLPACLHLTAYLPSSPFLMCLTDVKGGYYGSGRGHGGGRRGHGDMGEVKGVGKGSGRSGRDQEGVR
ncbi:hypothetical protein Pmani_037220 [Petrolisthes manimaculis]|uniref:Uncharacterized protein n=1 Tax=Petrolisthes manimaculis TaxID=1843537 RepID=A0AAE1TNH5_9EUCA|nr:hypothetical protein Pmani_037220 [Petrolisthes manimaculis]